MIETIKASELLVKKGFKVMVYTTDDPIVAKNWKTLDECNATGSAIGSGLGIINEFNIREIVENANIPLLWMVWELPVMHV